jgi:hypothetical protein
MTALALAKKTLIEGAKGFVAHFTFLANTRENLFFCQTVSPVKRFEIWPNRYRS